MWRKEDITPFQALCPWGGRKEEPLAEKVEGEALTWRGDWFRAQQTFKENIHRKG